MIYTQCDIDRFWSKISFPSDINSCWIWTASCDKDGYPFFHMNNKMIKGHRFSYLIHNQDTVTDFDSLYICHTCDNPPCVNPNHLYLGTHQINMNDRGLKNRTHHHIGSANGRSKLNDDIVRQIRLDLQTETVACVAKRYNVGATTIMNVKLGETWSHVL